MVLPGSAIGLIGGGENARMFAFAARRMGYRVSLYSPDPDDVARPVCDSGMRREFGDLISVREFASGVHVVTVAGGPVPVGALQAAADAALVRPSPGVFEAARMLAEAPDDAIAEFCIIGARGVNGVCVFYPPVAVDRVDGVPDIARSPAALNELPTRRAVGRVRDILQNLDLIGVASVELVLTRAGELVATEVTLHPSSAGYFTIDACVTSQFEQHLRAICGLPLGSSELLKPAATIGLRDADWEDGEPDWTSACAQPGLRLHLYGGSGNKGGSPRGHMTVTARSATLAKQIAKAARLSLKAEAPGVRPAAEPAE
jgi:phosphoribosylaminoimidazole carboxylase (NCAIR synthetase)